MINFNSGRHFFSTVDGKTESGKYNTFYSYGGRDLTLWRASDTTLLYDTGSAIEKAIEENFDSVFNSDPRQSELSPTDTKDLASTQKVTYTCIFSLHFAI